MKLFNWIIFCALFFLVHSCATKKSTYYLQNIEKEISQSDFSEASEQIQKNDELLIIISTLDPEASNPFNLRSTSSETKENLTHLVDSEGNIEMPVIGKLYVEGKTRIELQKELVNLLKRHLINPVVNIRIQNLRITVLGDVKSPGTYNVNSEKINILQAIGLAGDLNLTGERQEVVLVRESKEGRTYQRIDLRDANVLNKNYYQLQQNDIIYVPQGRVKIHSASISPLYSFGVSALGTTITLMNLYFTLSEKSKK